VIATIAAVALGLVLVVAGASKVAMGPAWPAQASSLGVPRGIAVVVPWVEVSVGAVLAVGILEPWPAAAAVLLVAAFTAVVVVNLVRGRRPVCACFGSLSARPIGWATVARNAVLLALGLVALAA
jgi:uncharacterized membrane protein YphA (DoxX/SURF4 family)